LNNGILDLALINASALDTALAVVTKINPAYVAGTINEKNYDVVNDGDEVSVYNSTVAGLYDQTLHAIVRADSVYDDISDLAEKTIVVGSYDYAARTVSFGLLKDHGIKRPARKLVVKTPKEAVEFFKNKGAEALFLYDRVPSDYVSKLCKSMKVKFLSIDPDRLRIITKYEKSLTSTTIPANQYAGQKHPVGAININILLQAHNGVSDDAIEELLKMMFDPDGDSDGDEVMDIDRKVLGYATAPQLNLLFHPEAADFYQKYGFIVRETKATTPLFDIHIVASQD
jgi:TRAP transporter TAXI family solute receptor